MLGEKIGEGRGQTTGQRVLPSENGMPQVETSFQSMDVVLGVETANMGTYHAVARPDGTLFGQGQGVLMGKNGEMASWTGHGIGRFTGPGGAVSFRGALYYQSASPAWARLNGAVGVYEYESDAQGKTHAQYWEWK